MSYEKIEKYNEQTLSSLMGNYKGILESLGEDVTREGLKDYEELFLMSECRHHIIANSTFSWWAAWLNPRADKTVIAPKHWIRGPIENYKDTVPESWITIDNIENK